MKKLIKFIIFLLFLFNNNIINTNNTADIYENVIPQAQINEDEINTLTSFTYKQYSSFNTYNRVEYFQNLDSYSPHNSVGSCGFVSLIQVLSYYDTFYDDTIISEAYDRRNSIATTLQESKEISPGVMKNIYSETIHGDYRNFCYNHMTYDFQSKLTILFNEFLEETNSNYSDFIVGINADNYQSLLNCFLAENSIVVNTQSGLTQTQYLQLTRELIGQGFPVILHVLDSTTPINNRSAHSIVAYNADETNIYANYGWSGHTNRPIFFSNYDQIYKIAYLDVSNRIHNHSNNYYYEGNHYCGCNISDNVEVESYGNTGSMINTPVVYWMNNLFDPDETFTIGIRTTMYGSNIETFNNIVNNRMIISTTSWLAITTSSDNYYYVYLKRNSALVNYQYKITAIRKTSII